MRGSRLSNALLVIAVVPLSLPVSSVDAQIASELRFEPYETFDVGSWPDSVSIGDYNSDGRNDVALATTFYFDSANDYKIFVFFQGADGKFGQPTKISSVGDLKNMYYETSLDTGDLNGDGRDDLVRATGLGIELHHQAPTGFKPRELIPTEYWVGQVISEDMDGDGDEDLVATGGIGTAVFRKTATGWSSSRFAASLEEIEVGDITKDGRVDVVGIQQNELRVYAQQIDGSFGPPIAYASQPSNRWLAGLEVADISGDGFLDAIVSYGGNRPRSKIKVFHGIAGGLLVGPVDYASLDIPEPVESMDMNQDGRSDVVTAHGGWIKVGVYLQRAPGLLEEEKLFQVPYASHYQPIGLALGDVTGDAKPDIVLADYWYGLVLLRQAA